jgi:hypothetical protein
LVEHSLDPLPIGDRFADFELNLDRVNLEEVMRELLHYVMELDFVLAVEDLKELLIGIYVGPG